MNLSPVRVILSSELLLVLTPTTLTTAGRLLGDNLRAANLTLTNCLMTECE